MAKLNKELQENIKEINSLMLLISDYENRFILTTSIHDNLIVVSINYYVNGNVETGKTFYLSEFHETEERNKEINKIKQMLGL